MLVWDKEMLFALCPSVSCSPPYSKVHTWEMLFGACGCCAASLPDMPWVPPTLLCFSDTASSETPPDGPGRLWFYLLTAAVSMCQPHNQDWVQLQIFSLPYASVSLQLLVQFCAVLLQNMETLGVLLRNWGRG